MDGMKIQAMGAEEVAISTKGGSITLTVVWYVPEIRGNRIAVSRMADARYTIEFGLTTCTISKAGICNTIGARNRTLYYLTTIESAINQSK